MATEDEVAAASNQFYLALNRMLNGDASQLAEIWSHGATVTTMHPVGGRDVGWDHVRQSWEQVAQLASDGDVHLDDQLIQVEGDTAYELGIERGQFSLAGEAIAIEIRVTNIYRREPGGWRIVHHHADSAQSMIDALNRVQER